MALLTTKKKAKKRTVILNRGRRFKGPARLAQIEEASSEEEDNQDKDVRRTRVGVEITKLPRMKTILKNSTHRWMKNTNN